MKIGAVCDHALRLVVWAVEKARWGEEKSRMRYLVILLSVLMFSGITLMPAWIIWVCRTSWPLLAKRLILTVMVGVSTLFATVVIIKPTTNQPAGIAANILLILYLLIVFIVAYKNWPR